MTEIDDAFSHNFRRNTDIYRLPPPSEDGYEDQLSSIKSNSLNLPYTFDIKPRSIPTNNGNLKYFRTSLQLVSAFCENVVGHPFIVLKRQCQVNPNGIRHHIVPLTLIPIIIRIQSRQGLGTLWKGIGSVFIVKGLVIVIEDVLSKLTLWPKDTRNITTVRRLVEHLFLKFLSAALVTPFYSACLIETVQSDIASEKPGIFDCLMEGVSRTIPHKGLSTSRMLPIWSLALPTAVYGLFNYTIATVVQRAVSMAWRFQRAHNKSTNDNNETEHEYVELTSYFIGHMVADIILYPCETVLNRLHVQGTRTIIDNLDTGYEVTPIITKYEGVIDCFQSIKGEEHTSGFFKGIGSLFLQYAIYFSVLKLTKYIFSEMKFERSNNITDTSRKMK